MKPAFSKHFGVKAPNQNLRTAVVLIYISMMEMFYQRFEVCFLIPMLRQLIMACTIVNPLTMLVLYGSREYNMNFYGSL